MTVPERKRRKLTGKGKGHTFLMLPHHVIRSPEWADLSASGVKLLLDMAGQYRGANNGDLSIAWALMQPRGWRSQDTLNRAKRELLEAGWMVTTRQGGMHKCSLYAVTWLPIDRCDAKHDWPAEHAPSNRWQRQRRHYGFRSDSMAIAPDSVAINSPKAANCSDNRSVQAGTGT